MFEKRIWLMLSMALLFISITAGCASSGSTVVQGSPTPSTPQSDNPYPLSSPIYQPYPGLEQTITNGASGHAPEPVPTPSADTGVVFGKLYDIETNQPLYDGVIVYLSKVVETDNSQMEAVRLDSTSNPNVIPDVDGGFAFANVAPGRYGIVVQGPINQYLTRNSNDQSKDVIVTVEAGQSIDVGKIYSAYP